MPTEQQDKLFTREEWELEHVDAIAQLQRQRESLAKAEAQLYEQRATVLRMMENLKALQQQVRGGQDGGAEQLRNENEQLRSDQERFYRENEQLRQEINELQVDREQLLEKLNATDSSAEEELRQLREEIVTLEQLLDEKDGQSNESHQGATDSEPEMEDPDSYEAELVRFRRELEAERAQFNHEVQMIRQRNTELEEATREMELEMSRERAKLARERSELERLRSEVESESHRIEHEKGISDRLAPLQRLRDQIVESHR